MKERNSAQRFDKAIADVKDLHNNLINMKLEGVNSIDNIIKEIKDKKNNWIKKTFYTSNKNVYILKSSDEEEKVIGQIIPRNKLVDELSAGYMLYFQTSNGLKRYSTMNWSYDELNKKQKDTQMQVTTAMDFYKGGHIDQYPKGTTSVFSNFTPRSSRLFNGSELYDNKVVNFGMQRFIKDFLINEWNTKFFNQSKEKVVGHYKRRMDTSLGKGEVKYEQLNDLHDLGYLPLSIRALPEGSRSKIKVPVFTVTNTLPEYYWIVNYFESIMSTELWKAYTMATVAFEFRRNFEHYAELTGAPKNFIPFQGHDFSMRGLSNRHEAYTNSIAHLTCFAGTDTVLAIDGAEDFYNADAEKELIGTSVNASEHATITMSIGNYIKKHERGILHVASVLPDRPNEWQTKDWRSDWQNDLNDAIKEGFKFIHTIDDDCYYKIIDESRVNSCSEEYAQKRSRMMLDNIEDRQTAELEVIKHLITKVYPTGIYSHVSDSYDYWHTISVTARKLKDIIINRQVNDLGLAKLTFRPDSGDPEKIICGLKIRDLMPYLNEINTLDKSMKEIAVYASNVINSTYYDGFFYKGDSWDWDGKLIDENVVKGSLEILWDIFGGEINDKGFKVLHPRVGLIYGDSITVARQESILKEMMSMNFSSENIIFGIGSYSYQFLTRDTLGFAMKATNGVVDGLNVAIFKDPKTDSGTKKSAKGLLRVVKSGGEYELHENCSLEEVDDNELEEVFRDSKLLIETSLAEIRERIIKELD